MPTPPDDDVWSATVVRVILAAVAAVLAVLGLAAGGWARWTLLAGAVLLACAAITPRYRNPNG